MQYSSLTFAQMVRHNRPVWKGLETVLLYVIAYKVVAIFQWFLIFLSFLNFIYHNNIWRRESYSFQFIFLFFCLLCSTCINLFYFHPSHSTILLLSIPCFSPLWPNFLFYFSSPLICHLSPSPPLCRRSSGRRWCSEHPLWSSGWSVSSPTLTSTPGSSRGSCTLASGSLCNSSPSTSHADNTPFSEVSM